VDAGRVAVQPVARDPRIGEHAVTRVATALLVIAVVILGVIVVKGDGGSSTTHVEAVFDTSRGVVPGQLVKIAGTRVGKISELELLRQRDGGYKALMRLEVDSRFAPFHADASCKILPEGLISENYVECDPGSPGRAELRDGPRGVPRLPVARTSASVSLQDVINTFSLPTDERIRLFLNTLGVGTAGRGEDINDILRRANPSLSQARRVLGLLASENRRIESAVTETDAVLRTVGRRSSDVRRFVDHTASVVRVTGARRQALGESVRGLPPMLDALRSGLRSFDRVSRQAPPLLAQLRASAPQLATLNRRVPSFVEEAVPAVRSVAAASQRGTAAIPAFRPVARHLNAFGDQAGPMASLLKDFFVNARDRGAIEGFFRFLYSLSTFSGPYDGISHFVGLTATLFPDCILSNMSPRPVKGCSHAYSAPMQGKAPVNAPNVDPGAWNTPDINTLSPSAVRGKLKKPGRLDTSEARQLLRFLLG
jgi:ABC-type transporter Mla subunit MlaD